MREISKRTVENSLKKLKKKKKKNSTKDTKSFAPYLVISLLLDELSKESRKRNIPILFRYKKFGEATLQSSISLFPSWIPMK